MKKQILIGLILGVCLLSTIGFAQSTASESVDRYNRQVSNLQDIARGFLGDEYLHLYIIEDTTDEYAAITDDGIITTFVDWVDSDADGNHDPWFSQGTVATMAVYVDVDTLERIDASPNPARAFLDAWGKEIRYEGLTLAAKIKEFFMGFVMWLAGLFVPDVDVATGLAVGEVCDHGGECTTGNCVGVGDGPPWTYKCSCDPFRFVAAGTDGECPPGSVTTQAQEQKAGLGIGEVCKNGGECESGNCVGVGQGPPWTYKCSCDPFVYDAFSCV